MYTHQYVYDVVSGSSEAQSPDGEIKQFMLNDTLILTQEKKLNQTSMMLPYGPQTIAMQEIVMPRGMT